MRTHTAFALVVVLLALAIAPWAISSCAQEPLLPNELRQQPTRYQLTVDASQNATRQAERAATSAPPKVIPLGTAPVTPENQTSVPPTEAPTATLTAAAPTITATAPISTEVSLTPAVESSTVVVISTSAVTDMPEATPRVIVVRSPSGVADATNMPQSTPTPAASAPVTATASATTPTLDTAVVTAPSAAAGAPTPTGMMDVEDILTEEMLAAQMRKDAEGTSLSDLTVNLDRSGVAATGVVRIFPAFRRPITATGNFAVENESLVIKISSILFNGRDVTEKHRAELESNVNTSLYRLLPQRYVQSFEMEDGRVIVHSKMRP